MHQWLHNGHILYHHIMLEGLQHLPMVLWVTVVQGVKEVTRLLQSQWFVTQLIRSSCQSILVQDTENPKLHLHMCVHITCFVAMDFTICQIST